MTGNDDVIIRCNLAGDLRPTAGSNSSCDDPWFEAAVPERRNNVAGTAASQDGFRRNRQALLGLYVESYIRIGAWPELTICVVEQFGLAMIPW